MGASIQVGHLLRVPLSLHFTWVLGWFLFPYLYWRVFNSLYDSWTTKEMWGAAFATTLLFFASILVHELSHTVMAMRKGATG